MVSGKKKAAYKKYARTGFAIKGVIYVLTGTLAVVAATGPGGKTIGRMGVIRWMDQLPLGNTLIVLIGIGLMGYVVLRFMQAIRDTNNKGTNGKGLVGRAAYLISGLIYLIFLTAILFLLFPEADVWKGEQVNYINKAFKLPAGNVAVAIAGIFSFLYGVFEIVRGVKGSYKHHLSFKRIKKRTKIMFTAIGAAGYVARGIVLALTGFFIVKAAWEAYAEKTHFTSKALEFISSYLGNFTMGVIASGLALYGIFNFVKARFYQVTIK